MEYRRAFVPGGSFFFTVVTDRREPLFARSENIATLRAVFRAVRLKRPFTIEAAVILPDHLHCIWRLPPEDADFSTRWRLIKTWFTKHCDPTIRAEPRRARISKREQALWQQSYWEHTLRDDTDYRRHVEYIHYNPVKHGYVKSPIEWPYSSFQRYVKVGVYPMDWGGEKINFDGVGQE